MQVTPSQMKMLQNELEDVRDRMTQGEATFDELCSLHEMIQRMLNDDPDGPYVEMLVQIRNLLDTVCETEIQRKRMMHALNEYQAMNQGWEPE